jgi:hypothetical protein
MSAKIDAFHTMRKLTLWIALAAVVGTAAYTPLSAEVFTISIDALQD